MQTHTTHSRTPTTQNQQRWSSRLVKSLNSSTKKGELKRVRNEKKETSRSPAEVEVQPKTSKASRNSWADIYNETTTLRKHKILLGQEVETDDGLEWRVKWGQRGAGFVCFSCADMLVCCKTNYCYYCIWFSYAYIFGILYYKNFSFVIAKRLLRENQRGYYSRV